MGTEVNSHWGIRGILGFLALLIGSSLGCSNDGGSSGSSVNAGSSAHQSASGVAGSSGATSSPGAGSGGASSGGVKASGGTSANTLSSTGSVAIGGSGAPLSTSASSPGGSDGRSTPGGGTTVTGGSVGASASTSTARPGGTTLGTHDHHRAEGGWFVHGHGRLSVGHRRHRYLYPGRHGPQVDAAHGGLFERQRLRGEDQLQRQRSGGQLISSHPKAQHPFGARS